MHVSAEELREHYHALSTDALLAISVSGELTEAASRLIDEELSKRDVTDNDVIHARYAQAVIEADRSVIRALSGKVREKGLIRILIALLGINADFLV